MGNFGIKLGWVLIVIIIEEVFDFYWVVFRGMKYIVRFRIVLLRNNCFNFV